jgi:hypothetical protein
LALRNDGNYGGQFVATLYKEDRRGEIDRILGRAIQTIDCPIAVRQDSTSLDLGFRTEEGQYHGPKRAAQMLLEPYLQWTLGLLDVELPEGKRRIGFGARGLS